MSLKPRGNPADSSIQIALEFLRSPLNTGAVAPSSATLVTDLINQIEFSQAKSIVELGPGTGAITESLVERLQADTHFFALELNPKFAEQTRRRCPGTIVKVGCATTLNEQLKHFGLDECDCVVSALPWTLFDAETQDRLIQSIRASLSPTGNFIFYTYLGAEWLPSGARLRQVVRKHFSAVRRVTHTFRNLPPAAVYVCHV